jgi:type IV pilus assembly protein PilP
MIKTLDSRLFAGFVLLALALAACSKQEDKPQPPPPRTAQQAKPANAPQAAVQKPLSSAAALPALDFHRRTDPFKAYVPPTAAAPQAAPKGEPARPVADLLPIQSFEASRFKVSGIIAGLKENRALILDPNGKGYVVQQGMQIGSNNGRISRITASGVEIIESFKNEKGQIKKRTIVLTLAKKR